MNTVWKAERVSDRKVVAQVSGMRHWTHRSLFVACAVMVTTLPIMVGCGAVRSPAPIALAHADYGNQVVSADARLLADWVAASRDNATAEFVIVDKKDARVYVFDARARLLASTAVLLGGAQGDDSVPGIGSRPIAEVRPEERTTPAGRFLAESGRNASGEEVVWVDYDAAVSMHRVRPTNPKERRLERLATPTPDDNRISYGCINVPVAFFDTFIQPAFAGQRALVYVLPEVKSLQQVFGVRDLAVAPLRLSGSMVPGTGIEPVRPLSRSGGF